MASRDMLAQIVRAAVGVDNTNHGILLDVINKLGGKDADGWRKRLGVALRERVGPPSFSVFRTIKLGTCANLTALEDAVNDVGCCTGAFAHDFPGFLDFTLAREETEVDLTIASVAELGFKDGAISLFDINRAANAYGLYFCPAEVGPQLRIQYTDQPTSECLRIAMNPLTMREGERGFFEVQHDDDGLCLAMHLGHYNSFVDADTRLVFVLPRT